MPCSACVFRSLPRVLSVLLIGISCVLTARADDDPILESNLTYSQAGGVDLKLDLARPGEEKGPYPTIIFIHGGGWQNGDRSAFRPTIEEAARRLFVGVTISYRLTETTGSSSINQFPAQIHDVKAAVRWLRANAVRYDVDTNWIGVTGTSAGGHLSLLLGTSAGNAVLEGEGGNPEQSSRVQAVVNQFGPTSLSRLYTTSPSSTAALVALLGGTPTEREMAYRLASPVNHVSADDPPVLTLHGTQDRIVPPEQAVLFNAALQGAGGRPTLQFIEGAHHGFQGANRQLADEAMFQFFDRHLKFGGVLSPIGGKGKLGSKIPALLPKRPRGSK